MSFTTLYECTFSPMLLFQITDLDGRKRYINFRELFHIKTEGNTVFTKHGCTFPIEYCPDLINLINQVMTKDSQSVFSTGSAGLVYGTIFHVTRLDPMYFLLTIKKSRYTAQSLFLQRGSLPQLLELLEKAVMEYSGKCNITLKRLHATNNFVLNKVQSFLLRRNPKYI